MMNVERAERLFTSLQIQPSIKSRTIQVTSIDDISVYNSDEQFDNFYNAKLATFEFGKGNFRDSVIHPSSPKYYAIKSHIRHFYSPPDEDIFDTGEFMQGDDFQFTTEPKPSTDWCYYIYLFLGVNLLVLGVFSLIVGLLLSDTDDDDDELKALWQLVGLAALFCGIIVVACSWLRGRSRSSIPPPTPAAYYCISLGCRGQRMPLYGTIGPIQPSFVVSQK